MIRIWPAILLGLLILYFLLVIVAIAVGSADLSIKKSALALIEWLHFPLKDSASNLKATDQIIIQQIRLPRIFMASIVGTGLAVVGATFQSLFKNPMADPYILGISSGAALGAALAIVCHLSNVGIFSWTMLLAFAGAMLTALFVYFVAQVRGKVSTTNLLLAGMSISFFLSALLSILIVFNQKEVNKIIFWMMGSFNASGWKQLGIVFPVVMIGTLVLYFFYNDLNLLLTGEDQAKTLGVETSRVKQIILVVTSLIVAVCVAFSGVIGFVGFLVPHMIRLIFGPNNKMLIPFSAVLGAIFLLGADTVARTVAMPAELPVGAVTAMIGSPFFIYLLFKMKKGNGA